MRQVTVEDYTVVRGRNRYLILFCGSQEGRPCKTKTQAQEKIADLVVTRNAKLAEQLKLIFRRLLDPTDRRDVLLAQHNGLSLASDKPVRELEDSQGFLYYQRA